MSTTIDSSYNSLLAHIGEALEYGRKKAVSRINESIVETYWTIGKYIVDFEQAGNEKAEYGSETLKRLSKDLIIRYGNGFGLSNVYRMRQLYTAFPIFATVSQKLSWSHYVELLKIADPLERSFYLKECEQENWGVRELRRQMQSMLFQRLALSKNKNEVLRLSEQGQVIEKPEDIIKDPYIFEFTGLPQLPVYKEGDLEDALIDNISTFLLELGKGFAFIGRQQRINIGGRIFKVDLVFYHRILKCFVLIDLKRGEVQHEDIGQMNLYLNYYREEMNTEGDTEPIGIVLGAYEDKLMVKYATQNISNQLFVSRYQLYFPDRSNLRTKFADFWITNGRLTTEKNLPHAQTKTDKIRRLTARLWSGHQERSSVNPPIDGYGSLSRCVMFHSHRNHHSVCFEGIYGFYRQFLQNMKYPHQNY